jgi:hypothetical protein
VPHTAQPHATIMPVAAAAVANTTASLSSSTTVTWVTG